MTKEDFEQWKDSSVTKEVMASIKDVRDNNGAECIKCSASGESVMATRLAGNVEAFDYLLNIQFEDTNND